MNSEQLKQHIVHALEDIKGRDIVELDVRGLTEMTDYMVIATGTSNRHVQALAGNVRDELRKESVRPIGVEGEGPAEWVLVDFGDVVLHVMLPQTRSFYDLERLWSEGRLTAPESSSG